MGEVQAPSAFHAFFPPKLTICICPFIVTVGTNLLAYSCYFLLWVRIVLNWCGDGRILSEDKVMVEQLRPDLLEREVNVKADGVQTAFRKVFLPPFLVAPSVYI